MSVAVVTLTHGRHDHLRRQVAGLRASSRPPDVHVVAAMDDPALRQGRVDGVGGPWPTEVVDVPVDERGLPLAAARNAAAARAAELGSELLVFLDVDCIPGPDTLRTYAHHALAAAPPPRPALWCGDVAYLPPSPEGYDLDRLAELGEHRPDRVRLAPGETRAEPDLRQFWSLSFALTAEDFATTGGFCPEFVGYGGEDTDFAMTVGSLGGSLTWVGGATAYHQHHPPASVDRGHVAAVVRNAGVFARRWGWWPMEGWLEDYARRGLAARGPDGVWVATP
ncbi:glycosyltransferase family 2 protein [Ornithinimicrobium sp. LYQ103]|uniref:glycosyltransferase family 2 protein n=1 Tax=Ornithinimicrobium sp. LYQ103 TaxID=3378796 RepID=UPI0038554942